MGCGCKSNGNPTDVSISGDTTSGSTKLTFTGNKLKDFGGFVLMLPVAIILSIPFLIHIGYVLLFRKNKSVNLIDVIDFFKFKKRKVDTPIVKT